jgi:hypothetical protein
MFSSPRRINCQSIIADNRGLNKKFVYLIAVALLPPDEKEIGYIV